MKIRTQIFAGYVLLALATLLVGSVSLTTLSDVSRQFDTAINHTQPVLAALGEIRLEAKTLALRAIGLHRRDEGAPAQPEADAPPANDADAPANDADAPRHEATIETLRAVLDDYRSRVARDFPEEMDEAAEIAERVDAFVETLEAPLAAGGKASAAERARIDTALHALHEAIIEAASAEEEEFRAQQHSIASGTAAHRMRILVAAALCTLAALGAGALLSHRISHPIARLRKGAERLGKGHLDTRVAVTARNEIGDLAQAFNHMAGELSTTLVSRDYVEAIIESMAEGVLVVDERGCVERCNTAMRLLFGTGQDTQPLEGRPLHELFSTDQSLASLMGGPDSRQGFEGRLRDGRPEPIIVAVSVSPVMLGMSRKGRVLLVQDITERKRQEDRLNYLASYDVLTGLPNRRMFLDHLRNSLVRLPWNKRTVGLLFCDLDRFKFVNDSLGHGIGDILLQRITERLRDVLRPGDVVGRWAGDEFVVMLDEIAHPDHIGKIAVKVVERLRQPVQIGPHELHVTVSIGTACAPDDATDADELVKNADLAMYAAKAAGKNAWACYVPEMRSRTELRLMLENALRHAIDTNDQLQVHYQPQQTLDGTLIGFEALVRWQHPQLGLISPAQFLPAAEEAGLMAALDESVLRMACAELRDWRESGWRDLRMAVNLSNQSFRRTDLAPMIARVIDAAGIPRDAIELELTEEIVMENVGSAIETMDELRALGVELSIDDFGTGYSSLSQLKRCPISLLKIDRSFIMDVIHDASDRAITKAIIALAHQLGIRVLAEGVETAEQLALLRESGCDAMQGYWLAKPMAADTTSAWLATRQR